MSVFSSSTAQWSMIPQVILFNLNLVSISGYYKLSLVTCCCLLLLVVGVQDCNIDRRAVDELNTNSIIESQIISYSLIFDLYSANAPANCDSITQWNLGHFNARVSRNQFVKLNCTLPPFPFGLRNIPLRQSNCPSPKCVIVDNHPTNLDQFHQPLMVVR